MDNWYLFNDQKDLRENLSSRPELNRHKQHYGNPQLILAIALASPVADSFDYLPGAFDESLMTLGIRVKVDFAGRKLIGIIVGIKATTDVDRQRLKPILAIIDDEPVIPAPLMTLLRRAARYYHHPLGEVILTALPTRLRNGQAIESTDKILWQASTSTRADELPELKRSPAQRACLAHLQISERAMEAFEMKPKVATPNAVLRNLLKKGLVQQVSRPTLPACDLFSADRPPILNPEQTSAVDATQARLGSFNVSLLDGITGSGKTEVYLALIKMVIDAGQQVLVLVPEISLTPQLNQRFTTRFGNAVVSMHSGLSDRQRQNNWRLSGQGIARIMLGTRSAIFAPVPTLGLIIVDEEHDPSLKQQEGFRYHARDLAILRGQIEGCPVLLGSATPALETLVHADSGKYHHLKLTQRAGDARPPQLHLVNSCRQEMVEGFSGFLIDKMRQHLEQGHQVLLFLNRRGYAPILLCHDCGATLDCPRCDAHTTYHRTFNELRCHHCGYHSPPPRHCPQCVEGKLLPLGLGTQKLESTLQGYFPNEPLIRIDRDSMSRKQALPDALNAISRGDFRIIIGTQMLAKGHDFPNITLVGMINVDQGLFSTDFRAQERLAQQILQVSGRAGRGKAQGEVVIQTHQPQHPLLQSLLTDNYRQIAAMLLLERQEINWPPSSHLALIRASAHTAGDAQQFLKEASAACQNMDSCQLDILGPVAAPLARKAGRYRYQLLLRATHRNLLHATLNQLIPMLRKMKSGRKARWSVDVDPVDLG